MRALLQLNRILAVLLLLLFSITSVQAQNPCNPSGKPYASLPGDTTITLPSGTTITMNRCEFFDKRDCLEIYELNTPEDLANENIRMHDEHGNVLITCGMFRINLKNCEKPCFEVPVKIKLKVRLQDCSKSEGGIPNLYFNRGSGWEIQKNNSKMTGAGNERFIEFETSCSMFINCDIPKKGSKTKFVAPKGMKIGAIRMGIDCPLLYYDEKPASARRKVKVNLICVSPARAKVQALMVTADGDTSTTAFHAVNILKHGNGRLRCRKEKAGFFTQLFGWLKPSKGEFRKKYFLPPR